MVTEGLEGSGSVHARLTCRDDVFSITLLDIQLDRVIDIAIREDLMSRTVVDLDDDALSLASEELGTKSKVATVNAALRRVANQRAAAHMLELLDETGADLSDEGLRGAWRDGGRG
jgi:Arc/MetJ family transcription regulator